MTSEVVAIASAGVAVVLVLLFTVEHYRGAIFFPRFRGLLDRLALNAASVFTKLKSVLTAGRVRILVHFLIHRLLAAVVAFCNRAAQFFVTLQKRNKQVARVVRKNSNDSHLSAVINDRRSNALTDKEKKELKNRSLEGK